MYMNWSSGSDSGYIMGFNTGSDIVGVLMEAEFAFHQLHLWGKVSDLTLVLELEHFVLLVLEVVEALLIVMLMDCSKHTTGLLSSCWLLSDD